MQKARKIALLLIFSVIHAFIFHTPVFSQRTTILATGSAEEGPRKIQSATSSTRLLYGQASYYAAKFEGRKTATGEIFRQNQMTAACNVLPLGTWVRVTNLRNGKSIVVRTNDRLHVKTRRIVDLTRVGAQQLGYINSGLTRVKVEVLDKKPRQKAK